MVSLLTALIIQGNDINVYPYQDQSSKLWGYELSRMERGNFRPVATYSAVYDSEDLAKQKGNALVAEIRGLNLSEQVKGIEVMLGKDGEVIKRIAYAASS